MSIPVAPGQPQFSGSLINPMYVHDKFIERLNKTLIFPEISTKAYERNFKNGGDSLTVFREQEGRALSYSKGQPLEIDHLNSEPITLKIDQSLYYNLLVEGLDKAQIHNVDARVRSYIDNSVWSGKQEIERRVLGYLPGSVSALNQGNNAGEASRSYSLGTSAAGGELTLDKTNIVAWLTRMAATLQEAGMPWTKKPAIVIPTVAAAVLNEAIEMTSRDFINHNGMTPTETGILPSLIKGFKVCVSDRVPSSLNAGGQKVYSVVALDPDAFAFYMQTDDSREVQDARYYGKFYQGFWSFGFQTLNPERMALSRARFVVN